MENKTDDYIPLIGFSILGIVMSVIFFYERCYWFGGTMTAISISIIAGLILRKILFAKGEKDE